jgi:hypothetical protein
MQLQNPLGICPDIYQLPSAAFHASVAPLWNDDVKIKVIISENVTELPCLSADSFFMSFGNVRTNLTTDNITYVFSSQDAQINFTYYGSDDELPIVMEAKLYFLYDWLCSQAEYILACENDREIMFAIKPYFDPYVLPSSTTRLSCKVDSHNFPTKMFIRENEMMLVECMVDMSNYVFEIPNLLSKLELLSISPKFAIIDDLDIELTVYVKTVYEIPSLSCKLNDIVLRGTRVKVD